MKSSLQTLEWDGQITFRSRKRLIRDLLKTAHVHHGICLCLLPLFLLFALLHVCWAQERATLITYGADAQTAEGDDDFKQVVFFTIPKATQSEKLHLRIFDPDVGGAWDQQYDEWNTETRFRLYGGKGAYTAPTVRLPSPEEADRLAGELIADTTFGVSDFSDKKWFNYATFAPGQGEAIGRIIVFKLVVDGMRGDDGNVFDVAVSTDPKRNNPPEGLRIITFCPTIRLPEIGVHAELRFSVPREVQEITIHNFDLAGAFMAVETRFRSKLAITSSAQGEWAHDRVLLEPDEAGALAALTYEGGLVVTDDSDSDGEIVAYLWDYGDGNVDSGVNVSHSYPKPGTYRVMLTVQDNAQSGNNIGTDQITVIVNDPPQAVASSDRSAVAPGEEIRFDGSASVDRDGQLIGYRWDMGDGTTRLGKQISHHYESPGLYTVKLAVTDDSGTSSDTDTDSLSLFINQAPKAEAGPSQLVSSSEVRFNGTKSEDPDGTIVEYAWDFGDGTFQDGPKPTHVFAEPGTYMVTLTIYGDQIGNCDNETTVMVKVNFPPKAEAGPNCLVCPGEKVIFKGSESWDRDGVITEHAWSFGDGETGEGVKVAHAYDKPGEYRVTLRVRDDSGTTCDLAQDTSIVQVNSPPIADAGPDVETFYGGAYDAVVFDGTRSRDPDRNPLTYHWEFGDGSVGVGPKAPHTYKKPGSYTACLRVSDGRKTICSESIDEVTVIVKSRVTERR